MSRGRQRGKETTIPYYQLRQTVQREYGLRNLLRKSGIYGSIMGLLGGGAYFLMTPGSSILMAIGLTIILALGIFIGALLLDFLAEIITISSKEEELVEACLQQIDRWRDDAKTRRAIHEMADKPGDRVQILTILPVILVTVISTLAVSAHLPITIAIILGELAILTLFSFGFTIGQANADIIIRNALTEFERRLVVEKPVAESEPAPATEAPVPLLAPAPSAGAPASASGTAAPAASR